ncbi:hypothetical protein KHA80_13895 [Anaerobacillus sp. HL2]|nr:hypothetical protein KHA80_13895 [Anaerobacillus sp. HL2]
MGSSAPSGINLSHEEFHNLGVAPNNGDIAYAATSKGLFYSSNGVEWNKNIRWIYYSIKCHWRRWNCLL